MSYRKSSHSNIQNFNYNTNLNFSYSSSNVPSIYNLPETSPRGIYSRKGSKTNSLTDFSSLKKPLFPSNEKASSIISPQKNDNAYLQQGPRKVSYMSREYTNKTLSKDIVEECNNNDAHFPFTNNFSQPLGKSTNKNVKTATPGTGNVFESNLQQEFLKRLLNAHNTVDNLLRGRGLHIEDESNYLMSKFNRHQEAETSTHYENDSVRRFGTTKYNFITKKYSQSTINSTTDSETSSAYSSSSMEISSVPENISEADDTSVDSVLHTDSEEELPEEDISAHSFLEVNLSEYVPNSKNLLSQSGDTIKILPTPQKQNVLFNITSKQFYLHNPFDNTKGSTTVILPQYTKSAVSLKVTFPLPQINVFKKIKEIKNGKPVMIKKKIPKLRKMVKINKDEEQNICQCKAEISIQHFSYSYKKSEKVEYQNKSSLYPPPEKLIRLHLRLTNHPPLKADATSTFILNKQTIKIEKNIKIVNKRRDDKGKIMVNNKKNYSPKSVNLHMFDKNDTSTRKDSLTPQYNLKVPEVFLKDDKNKITNNNIAIKGKRKPLSGVNIIKMLIEKQNQNAPTNDTEDKYRAVKANLKKVNFPETVLSKNANKMTSGTIKSRLENKENKISDKIDENCLKVTNLLNDNQKPSSFEKENKPSFYIDIDIIDKKLIERFCNTDHIPKPVSIVKNYCIPTMPNKLKDKEREIILEKETNMNTPRFIRYKSPKRLVIDEEKINDKTILKEKVLKTIRRNSVDPEVIFTTNREKKHLVRSYSECPKATKNVYSHSLHNFGVSLKSVKERLLQTKEDLDRKPPKEVFVPQWRKTSITFTNNENKILA